MKIIYKTINLLNNKIYVGQDSKNNSNYFGSGKYLISSIKKYGKENFKKEIICECNSDEELNEKEKYWIEALNCKVPNGYNISNGGDGVVGRKHTEEEKVQMRERMKGNKYSLGFKCREETKEKLRIKSTGKIHSIETRNKISEKNKGIKFTNEHNLKVSNKLKGRVISKEWREKISEGNKGKIIPEKQKIKMKEFMKGNKYNLGNKYSEETKIKISQSNKGKKHTEESKIKISKSHIGKTHSEETKLKMRESRKLYLIKVKK